VPELANILLVDDKPARLLTYEVILERLGQNLVRAHSGEEALARLEECEFAAILLDVSMPGMDGFETARRIRESPVFGNTPIIFVTGVHLTDLDRLRGYEMGAADYVYVPVVPEILRGKVQVLVQLFQQRRELARLNEVLAATNRQLAAAHAKLRDENTRELQKLNRTLELANTQLVSEIAERKRAESLLREAARRKDEFISILAHELRNPLAAMQSGVDLLSQPKLLERMLPWASDLLRRQLEHLTRLIDDLLDVSRVSNGRVQLKRERLDLRQVIEHSFDAARSLIDEKEHAVTVVLPDEPVYVDGDTVRLTQVFGNLLTNAAKYTPKGGSIRLTVDTEDDGSTVVVRVRDDGEGIAPDMLERVFELFTQAHTPGSRTQTGLGIGLALVRGLVEMHGGHVSAASDGPGKGAEFTVRLPLAAAPAPVQRETRSAAEPVAVGLKILIIDDNVDLAHGLSTYLANKWHHDVHVAHTGLAGIEAVERIQPDAVLLDIGLPDLDGFEVARRIRGSLGLDRVPLLALSGFSSDEDRERAAGVGFDRYFVKPVRFDALMEAIGELWRSRGGRTCSSPPSDPVRTASARDA